MATVQLSGRLNSEEQVSGTLSGSGKLSGSLSAGVVEGLSTVIQVTNIASLPNRGQESALYIVKADNAAYRWDEDASKYYCVGRDWENIKVITGGGSSNE